ncbi:hypothetical protein DF3PA_240003 [Candidatus Defluviicoccus seviourii]|uniref:SGNH hydrolase-type esterase domain-containing protein n=1 Tax=Candidatus Defluviicoccus seviourii TaxID=2565273 RepID=A0A564WEX8_9PROT|nr:hypothetical protein DF3PA_240003 [Candidatus Defluviicoccus seviourii]
MALTIMPLGDSITVGISDKDDFGKDVRATLGGYRKILYEKLGDKIEFIGEAVDREGESVSPAWPDLDERAELGSHSGFPGIYSGTYTEQYDPNNHKFSSYNLINKIDSLFLKFQPEAVILMIGSNDLNREERLKYSGMTTSYSDDPIKGSIAKQAAHDRVGAIIDEIRNADTDPNTAGVQKNIDIHIFVATVPPPQDVDNLSLWPGDTEISGYSNTANFVGPNPAGLAGWDWNLGILASVQEKLDAGDTKVHFVDMRESFNEIGSMTALSLDPSGLHPSETGYANIAEKWKDALEDVFPELKPSSTTIPEDLSEAFAAYATSVSGGQPVVSLGEGDGKDQVVAFQFIFEPPATITAATLTLEMKPGHSWVDTDELLFFDNISTRGPEGKKFGNAHISYLYHHDGLPLHETSTVTFDLLSIDTKTGKENLVDLLDGGLGTGYLGVVYADDAIISSAQLDVTGDFGDHEAGTTRSIAGTGISQRYLGGGNDSAGGHSVDWIYGESGNDTIWGYDGDDTLFGGKGNDSLAGGDDDDLIVGGDDNDTLDGQNGNDSIYGDLGHERNEGNDVINGGNGEDQVLAGGGSDTVYGGLDDDWLNGQWGSDWVSGDGGNDVIIGEDGNDTLYGGSGDDYFLAGKGGDYATGGAGNDTITFDDILQTSKLYGFDKIRGFDNPGPKAGDVIDLSPIDARPDIDGNQAFKLVPADKPQWGGVRAFDHSWDNSTMVQGWIGPTPYAPHGDWFQFWILDGPDVHARDYTEEDFVL